MTLFKALYDNSSCCVKTSTGYTEFFEIVSGVRQGCILSPFLFTIVIDFIIRKAVDPSRLGIGWKNDKLLTDLDFADDTARVAEDDHVCQEITTNLADHSAKFGLHVSQ